MTWLIGANTPCTNHYTNMYEDKQEHMKPVVLTHNCPLPFHLLVASQDSSFKSISLSSSSFSPPQKMESTKAQGKRSFKTEDEDDDEEEEGENEQMRKREIELNGGALGNLTTSSPISSKRGSASATIRPSCQAERCNADLSEAKQYYRRHKVCDFHSKAPAVVIGGLQQRFCQQCSRFHGLTEFDDNKRSCRRRLAGHNERRRKTNSDYVN